MANWIETFLWSIYDFAEIYTFLLVWIVVPLSFSIFFLYVRSASTPISKSESVRAPEAFPAVESPSDTSNLASKDSKVNLNEANA